MRTTPTGWLLEDKQHDYVLFSRQAGNAVIVLCMDTDKESAELFIETVKADGMVENTGTVTFEWETALHMLGLKEGELHERD